jgi:hypothetical protein
VRLSEVLNRAPDTSRAEVENFLGLRRLSWGSHKTIRVGKVIRNYFCRGCGATRTFISGDSLSCLITGERSVSIDVTVRCSVCKSPMEAWFLVGCADDLFSQSPLVHLERFTENRRDTAGRAGVQNGQIDDLFERAQIAFEDHLGAGALIYLRQIFEMTTAQVAVTVGIATQKPNGWRKSFKELLEEVDQTSHIIPAEFSANGYKLFGELSEVIHGASNETDALAKFEPCRELVFGIVANVRNNQSMARAAASLWNSAANVLIAEQEVAHESDR